MSVRKNEMDFKSTIREFLENGGWLVTLIGALGMFARILLDNKKYSLLSMLKKILSAAIFSGIAWFILNEAPISDFLKAISYGIIGVVSPEIVNGIVSLAKKFEKNPDKFIKS